MVPINQYDIVSRRINMKVLRVVFGLVLTVSFSVSSGSTQNISESDVGLSYNFSREIFSLLPIFPTFSDKIQNERCRNDSRIFREQLAQFRLWAVKSKLLIFFKKENNLHVRAGKLKCPIMWIRSGPL